MLKTVGVALLLVLAAGNSEAIVGQSGFWLTGTGAYAIGKNTQSDQMIDGAAMAVTLEGMRGANVSLGLSLAYATMETELNVGGVATKYRVSSMPAYVVLRYWLGPEENPVRGYVGGAVGLYISFLDTTNLNENKQTTLGMSGVALGVPVGFIYTLNERLFLNVNYSLNWLADNDYLDNGLLHAFGFGLGFTFAN